MENFGSGRFRRLLEGLREFPHQTNCELEMFSDVLHYYTVRELGLPAEIEQIVQEVSSKHRQFWPQISGRLPMLNTLRLRFLGVHPLNVDMTDRLLKDLSYVSPNLEALTLLLNEDTQLPEKFSYFLVHSIEDAAKLGELPEVDFFELEGSAWEDQDVARLVECVSRNVTLKGLHFRTTELGEVSRGALEAAMAAGDLKNLEKFMVQSPGSGRQGQQCNFGEAALNSFIKGAPWGFRGLKTLLLDNLDSDLVEMLAKLLKDGTFPVLRFLSLEGRRHRNAGWTALAGAIQSDKVADFISFAHPNIMREDRAVCELAQVIAEGHLPKLKFLRLGEVHAEAAEALARAYQNNPFLIADLFVIWPPGPWKENWIGFHARNVTQVQTLNALAGTKVPAKQGRVFLCGEPYVGKTTLRKSLSKSHTRYFSSIASGVCCSSRGDNEQRTRGIEVVQIAEEDITLGVWDLAGQHEYHILHGTFFPDLAYTDVCATIFVVVCKSFSATSRKDLRYWLRFIAASSLRGMRGLKRQVIIVHNRFDNTLCDHGTRPSWTQELEHFKNDFEDYLEITFETDSCCFDVRSSRKARVLKQMMVLKTKKMLHGKQIPKVCQDLELVFQQWAEQHKLFPILKWDIMQKQVHTRRPFMGLTHETLVSAVNYLNQVGVVIHFPEGSLEDGGLPKSDLIVVKPEWFCMEVVGNLLLPEGLLDDRDASLLRDKLNEDHTMDISVLREYYKELSDSEMKEAIAILLRMGLCFLVDPTKILIPVLVPRDTSLPPWWTDRMDGQDNQWVMGFSLVPIDAKKTLLPASLFSRLQVELAQDTKIRHQIGNDFSASSTFVAFRALQMKVLIEFRAEEKNAIADRVDIMVKPSLQEADDVGPSERRAKQVNYADALLEKLDDIRRKCCPGVQFQRRVIQPWSVADKHQKMSERNVNELVDSLKKDLNSPDLNPDSELTEWDVKGRRVRNADLLSERDLKDVAEELQSAVSAMREGTEVAEVLSKGLGVTKISAVNTPLAMPRFDRIHSLPDAHGNFGGVRSGFSQTSCERISKLETRLEGFETAVWTEFRNLREQKKSELEEVRTYRRCLEDQLRSIEITIWEERHNCVPRFVYFTRSKSKEWIKLREILNVRESSTLHLLCEAQFDDHQLHQVENQRGIESSSLKDWVTKYAVWLKWSVNILGALCSIGGAAIPGLGALAPGLVAGGTQIANTAIDQIKECAMLTSIIEASVAAGGSHTPGDTKGQTPITDLAKLAMKDLLEDLRPIRFKEHFGLRKVWLSTPDRASKPDGRQSVVWVCDDCFDKYKATNTAEAI